MPQRLAIKYCRHCGRIIPLDSAECAYCGKVVIRLDQQKVCPFCSETIKAKAIKCKHCGEFVDGRAARPPDRQQVLHIEKAIIATTGREGEIELRRPDGRRLEVSELGPAARGELPGAAEPEKALPVVQTAEKQPADEQPAKAPPEQPPPEAPPVELECPSCNRTVFEGDHYCENCGRDLTLPKGHPSYRPIARPYGAADYALILSGVAPLGLLLPSPYSALIAAGGVGVGGWCLWRIASSGGRLKGMKPSLWAIAIGLFWLATILIVKGR